MQNKPASKELILLYFHFRQVIMVLSQLERMSPYHLSRRLVHRQDYYRTGLGDWAPPNVIHDPALNDLVIGLHSPRPL